MTNNASYKNTSQSLDIVICDFDDIKNPLLAAGQAIATAEFGKRMAANGHRITVLANRYPGSKDRTENGIFYRHIGIGSKNIRLNNFTYFFFLPFTIRKIKADVIAECFTAPISTLFTPLFTKIPVVVIPSCFDAKRFSELYHFPFDRIEKFGLRFYKYFLPYSTAIESQIRQHVPNAVCSIVPEGVDEKFFDIPRKKAKHILFLGRMDMRQKGLDLLLQAYAQIKDQCQLPLVIAGNGPDESKVKELIKKLQLEDRVSMLGATYGEKKQQVLEEAAFVAFTSRNETFSCFALEALASGLPLVAFDIPGLCWTDQKSTLKAPSFDVDTYSQLLLKMSNPEVYKPMSTEARKYAKKFTWDNMADKYETFFTDVKNGKYE